jgi:tetratricopeptide (TPR) repeat protein
LQIALAELKEIPAQLDSDKVKREPDYDPRYLQVWFLHGTSTSYQQRHTTSETKRAIPHLKSFLQRAFNRGLIIVGYRGGDETPMDTLMEVVSEKGDGPGRGLYWVTKDNDKALLPRVQKLLEFDDTYLVSDQDADQFFETLNQEIFGLPIDPDGIVRVPLRGTAPQFVYDAKLPFALGDDARAIAYCSQALESDPEYAPAYVFWGDVLVRQQNFSEAIEKYRKATEIPSEISPPSRDAFLGWGRALAGIGADQEAIEKYEKAAALDLEHAFTYQHWAESLKKLGRSRDAREKEQQYESLKRARVSGR